MKTYFVWFCLSHPTQRRLSCALGSQDLLWLTDSFLLSEWWMVTENPLPSLTWVVSLSSTSTSSLTLWKGSRDFELYWELVRLSFPLFLTLWLWSYWRRIEWRSSLSLIVHHGDIITTVLSLWSPGRVWMAETVLVSRQSIQKVHRLVVSAHESAGRDVEKDGVVGKYPGVDFLGCCALSVLGCLLGLGMQEKDKHHTIQLIRGIQNNDANEIIFKTEVDSQTWKTDLWLPEGKGRWGGLNWEFRINIDTLLRIK